VADLASLLSALAGFAKTRFRVVPADRVEHINDRIEAAHEDDVEADIWDSFAEIAADHCAAPLVEILNGADRLMRMARLGEAYVAMRQVPRWWTLPASSSRDVFLEAERAERASRDALDAAFASVTKEQR
jgi:hypothetical protein